MKPLHISIIWLTFATFLNAAIAQLVEHDLAKVGVASSSLVFRSRSHPETDGFFCVVAEPVEATGDLKDQVQKYVFRHIS